MGGRFNRVLEFIGLVDDEPEGDMDPSRRPAGAQTYQTAQNRRGSQRSLYEGGESRYSSPRPEYEARRRSDPNLYGGGGYQPSYRGEYGARDGYRPQPARPEPRYTPPRDPFEEAFDQDAQRRAARFQQNQPVSQQRNVVPMRQPETEHHTVIYYLRQLEECRDVINDLLDNRSVLLNLEDMDERNMQRCIDTMCGAAFALGASLRKASDKTYLIAPKSVKVASTRESNDGGRY
jgi:FtsZ-interacting cell division protein YlmF